MKLSSLAAGVALSALMVTGAVAADVYTGDKSLKDDSNYASGEVVNWTGFYIGVQGGYGNANHKLSAEEYCVTDGNEPNVDALGTIDGINSHGAIGGGRVGYDFSRGRFLAGIFAEYNFSAMETEVTIPGDPGIKVGLEKDNEWSVGGRLGYLLAPRTLVYVLAAYTQTDYNVTGFEGVALEEGQFLKRSATFDGVSVGGGLEVALTGNVFLGLEYTHTFYGKETIFDAGYAWDGGRHGTRVDDELDEDKVMATLKLKLNDNLFGK